MGWSNDRTSITIAGVKMKEKYISASEFKAKCLRILEDLDPQGIVITKRGQPIARVTPAVSHDNQSLIGSLRGKIEVNACLFWTGVTWDAEVSNRSICGRINPPAFFCR